MHTTETQPAPHYQTLSCARQTLVKTFWQDVLSTQKMHDSTITFDTFFSYSCALIDTLEQIPPQAMAIILSVDSTNFTRYQQTQVFLSLMQILESTCNACGLNTNHLVAIQILQGSIVAHTDISKLQESRGFIEHIIAARLCDTEWVRRLFTMLDKFFLDSKQPATPLESTNHTISAKALENELITIANALQSALPHTKPTLDAITMRLRDKSFSIGVAGILNAGKSSFLNALLGKPVLGTSTIPETAALTILHYNDQESAMVEFFTQEEWEQAQHKSSDTLTNEQKALLNIEQKSIAINELALYTSANHASGFYSLVKQVKLGLPLAFLQNNVQIIDTPGLDDPIIIREELTKSYIRHCDMLIYVMNASCAATQKDMDFILESLISGHVARLLVVLTRADLLSDKELESGLHYTHQSLQKELQKAHYEGDIQAIIDSIDFIPVSSLFALGYKTNNQHLIDKAQAQGFTLEQTGFPQVEAYLDSMLFGDNAHKQRDLLYSAYKGLLLELQEADGYLELQQRIMQANSQDKQTIAQELHDKNDKLIESINDIRKQMELFTKDFMAYLHELVSLIDAHLHTHTQKLATQLYDDAIYEYAKNSKPSHSRIQSIIHQSLQDSYHDLMREYKYKVAKKLRTLNELTPSTISDKPLEMPPIIHPDHSATITTLATTLATSIQELNATHNKNSQEKLRASLQELLRLKLVDFTSLLMQENTRIQSLLDNSIASYTKEQTTALQEKISRNLVALESALASSTDTQTLESTHKTIQSLRNEVQMILKAL